MESFPGAGKRKLRVRTGKIYAVPFNIDLGQRNAEFLKGPLTPLYRFWKQAIAFAPLPGGGFDMVHSFDAVPLLTRKPYIVTFEDYLPYTPPDMYSRWLEKMLQKTLCSDQCVAIIAMSAYAKDQFSEQCARFAEGAKLLDKSEVLYPAIAKRREAPKRPSGKLKLAFVGADFMRKGGPALLRAHEKLRALGLPVETTIISSLRWSPADYIGPTKMYDVSAEVRRIQQPGITHLSSIPNDEVMKVVEDADYFVFPTFHDTFGYAPLEALACGTPVIATNTAAQPEIIEDGKSGRLLPFENGPGGKWKWIYRKSDAGYDDAYGQAVENLSQSITDTLSELFAGDSYEEMSAAALHRIDARFSVSRARDRLEELYELCRLK